MQARKAVHPHYVHLLIPFVIWGALELFKEIELKSWHKKMVYTFCLLGFLGTFNLNRKVDGLNSIQVQRKLISEIKQRNLNIMKIDSDFFLSPESYEILSRIEHHFPLDLVLPKEQGEIPQYKVILKRKFSKR